MYGPSHWFYGTGTPVVRSEIDSETKGDNKVVKMSLIHAKSAQSRSAKVYTIPPENKATVRPSLYKTVHFDHKTICQSGRSLNLNLTLMNQPENLELPPLLTQLFARINYERRDGTKRFAFKLDGIRQLLAELDNPHLKCPVVHVAGTKGKGSVSRMIGAILTESGLKTGVYTSPHLERINQRVAVDGNSISDEELATALAEIAPAVEKVDKTNELAELRPLTFFEVITTAAFYHFAKSKCEAVVLEVGMGGRLDSTNVCKPKLCVITNINFDHTRQLGNTLELIAREKAGIVKPGVPLICGETKLQPKAAIHAVADSAGAEVWQINRDFTVILDSNQNAKASSDQSDKQSDKHRSTVFDTWGKVDTDTTRGLNPERKADFQWAIDDVRLGLLGTHQAANAAIAIAAAQRLVLEGWEISNSQIRSALEKVRLAGRTEVISESPTVVMDIAHNVISIEALLETLRQNFSSWNSAGRKRLMLAVSSDKDTAGILRMLVDTFDDIVVTQYQLNPRFVPIDDLAEMTEVIREGLKTDTRIRTASDPAAAWSLMQSDMADDDFVCITGSVFLVAEMRPLLVGQKSDRT